MGDIEELWDWRRQVADLYHEVRSTQPPQQAWRLWCDRRTDLFRTHPQSPATAPPAVFAYDPALRLDVGMVPAAADRLTVATGADGTTHMRAFARTEGLLGRLGGELTVYWIEGYGGGVFLPFADETNGGETYGGGRYLLDTIKGADPGAIQPDGSLRLDFNFSYFPSCAYSARWVCPLAPPGNRLPGAVRAGERLAGGR